MKTRMLSLLLAAAAGCLIAAEPEAAALKWDTQSQKYAPKSGETDATYKFTATNASKNEVLINKLLTSCGCTVAQLPATPYKLAPGSNVTLNVSINFAGKQGLITKSVTVDTSAGMQVLFVSAEIPVEKKS